MSKTVQNPDGEITYSCYPEKVEIDFCDNAKGIPSEIMALRFVTKSYFDSCIVLLNEVEKYSFSNNIENTQKCIFKFLPAFFCYRHYIELKLKCLYMEETGEYFGTVHKLTSLLEALEKKTGRDFSIFRYSIAFVEQNEKKIGDAELDSYSRYLVNKIYSFAQNLTINISDVKMMKWTLISIEERIEDIQNILLFNEQLKKMKRGEFSTTLEERELEFEKIKRLCEQFNANFDNDRIEEV